MDDNDSFAFIFIRNRTISLISGSFFCHPTTSVQANEASWQCPFYLSFQRQGRRSPSQRRQPLRPFWKRDNDWCIAVSYWLITGDGIAIIRYRCHLSGAQSQRQSVAQRGGRSRLGPRLNPLLFSHNQFLTGNCFTWQFKQVKSGHCKRWVCVFFCFRNYWLHGRI